MRRSLISCKRGCRALGDAFDCLTTVVYSELHCIANAYMRRERPGSRRLRAARRGRSLGRTPLHVRRLIEWRHRRQNEPVGVDSGADPHLGRLSALQALEIDRRARLLVRGGDRFEIPERP